MDIKSETKINQKSDHDDVTDFIEKNFEKRECNRFCKSSNDNKICRCGYSEKAHSHEARQNNSNESEPLTKTFQTDAFGKLDFVEGKETIQLKNRQYVRLDYKTDVNKIVKFCFDIWKMDEPDVILSVISDSDFSTGNGNEVIEAKPSRRIENVRKMVCSALVEAAASTKAWITTGGLNKDIYQLIGYEVKQRLADYDKIPQAVLGFSNWGCLAQKKTLLNNSYGPDGYESDSNPIGLSLNQHHTHFLLVDDGTQKMSGCEFELRRSVELALTKRETNENEKDLSTPLIYILIGGNIAAFDFVNQALAKRIPVIVAVGTGGAADVILEELASTDGPTLEHLPEIAERMFNQLKELLTAGGASENKVRQVIAKITAETKLELFLQIVELLEKRPTYIQGTFKADIDRLEKETFHEPLAGIKDLLIKKTEADDAQCSASKGMRVVFDGMRIVFEHMLYVNQIPKDKATKAVRDLDKDIKFDMLTKIKPVLTKDLAKDAPDDAVNKTKDILKNSVLNKTLENVKSVLENLKAIRKHDQRHLLIKFNITFKEKKPITRLIVEALRKAKWTKTCSVYTLAADWDNEIVFRQMLMENWMVDKHNSVFRKLLENKTSDVTKYVKLIMEHNSNSSWLTSSRGPLEEDFRKSPLCQKLLKQIKHPVNNISNRIKGKLLFVWCIQKKMPETAMLFWKQGQDCLAMALVAYKESQEQKKALVKKKGYEQMEKQMEFFSNLALDFLKTCYEDNQTRTRDLLLGDVEDLDDRCPFLLAADATFLGFFLVDATQDVFNDIWTKDIRNYDIYKYVPMLLSEACPLLAPVLLDIQIPPVNGNDKEKNSPPTRGRNYFSKVGSFIDTPLVKFSYWIISYFAYLTLFSIVMLTDFRGQMSPSEIALTIWTFILTIEEVKQAIGDVQYKTNTWNYFDIGALTLYIIGFILRMIYHGDPSICPDCLYVARIVLAFSLLIFFFRTLQFLSIYDTLGPKILMINQLVADLVGFLLIMAVFITAYGVVSNVILYPNQKLTAELLKDVFYDAWWSVLQQFNREEALGLRCNEKNSSLQIPAEICYSQNVSNINYVACKENKCPADTWIVSVLLAFYALLTCIMMLNVLIAMFNKTFTDINDNQTLFSKSLRCLLIAEYMSRSMVPAPLCVITYPYFIIKYLFNKCKSWLKHDKHSQAENQDTESPPNDNESKDEEPEKKQKLLRDWEHKVVAEYCKENKDKEGWFVARMESETSNNFDEEPLIKYIIQLIRNQTKEEQPSRETYNTVYNWETEESDEETETTKKQETEESDEETETTKKQESDKKKKSRPMSETMVILESDKKKKSRPMSETMVILESDEKKKKSRPVSKTMVIRDT